MSVAHGANHGQSVGIAGHMQVSKQHVKRPGNDALQSFIDAGRCNYFKTVDFQLFLQVGAYYFVIVYE
jgi:hypothetical protein